MILSVREKRYEAVEALYHLFSVFMTLYREANSPDTDLSNPEIKKDLLKRAIQAESELDALILRIGCEFAHRSETGLEDLLGNLRQSVQVWREAIQGSQKLPFYSSDQSDYVRFKETFARTAAFMVHRIHDRLEPSLTLQEQAADMLMGAFSNKYELAIYKPVHKPGI